MSNSRRPLLLGPGEMALHVRLHQHETHCHRFHCSTFPQRLDALVMPFDHLRRHGFSQSEQRDPTVLRLVQSPAIARSAGHLSRMRRPDLTPMQSLGPVRIGVAAAGVAYTGFPIRVGGVWRTLSHLAIRLAASGIPYPAFPSHVVVVFGSVNRDVRRHFAIHDPVCIRDWSNSSAPRRRQACLMRRYVSLSRRFMAKWCHIHAFRGEFFLRRHNPFVGISGRSLRGEKVNILCFASFHLPPSPFARLGVMR